MLNALMNTYCFQNEARLLKSTLVKIFLKLYSWLLGQRHNGYNHIENTSTLIASFSLFIFIYAKPLWYELLITSTTTCSEMFLLLSFFFISLSLSHQAGQGCINASSVAQCSLKTLIATVQQLQHTGLKIDMGKGSMLCISTLKGKITEGFLCFFVVFFF